MIAEITEANLATLKSFDAVIDVRSPAEFKEDHAPGAINLPVLSDAQRAEVGTIYVQDDPFRARRLGAALVAQNIARHLEGPLAGLGGAWRPLVYCWRGGQRSNAMATVLAQVGWRTTLLRGGYKTYRRGVVRRLYDEPLGLTLVLLDGPTGVGKTQVLHRLPGLGVQTLDLEGLADHRGSLFGAWPGRPQPSQKLFESRLFAALCALDPARPVIVEAESSKVGERALPPGLWTAMTVAPAITLEAPLAARARRLVLSYGGAGPDRDAALSAALGRLPRHIGRADIAVWRDLLAAGELEPLARELMERHYDPAYARSHEPRRAVALAAMDGDFETAPQRAAEAIAARLGEGSLP